MNTQAFENNLENSPNQTPSSPQAGSFTKVASFVNADNNINSDNSSDKNKPLRFYVEHALKNYLKNVDQPADVYNMVLAQIEPPVLESIMEFTRGNQSKAAILLGLSRGTLRKKLKQYDIA
jgi:Fis family transcriptional regulator, factor for inversion stimulation protein